MKVVFSVLLSASLIFQTFNLPTEHIGDFGELWEHFEYHSLEYDDSLADFLIKHYGSQKAEHSNEHPEHEKLPFNQNSSTLSGTVFVVDFQKLPSINPLLIINKPGNFFYSSFYTFLSQVQIFQPPKTA